MGGKASKHEHDKEIVELDSKKKRKKRKKKSSDEMNGRYVIDHRFRYEHDCRFRYGHDDRFTRNYDVRCNNVLRNVSREGAFQNVSGQNNFTGGACRYNQVFPNTYAPYWDFTKRTLIANPPVSTSGNVIQKESKVGTGVPHVQEAKISNFPSQQALQHSNEEPKNSVNNGESCRSTSVCKKNSRLFQKAMDQVRGLTFTPSPNLDESEAKGKKRKRSRNRRKSSPEPSDPPSESLKKRIKTASYEAERIVSDFRKSTRAILEQFDQFCLMKTRSYDTPEPLPKELSQVL